MSGFWLVSYVLLWIALAVTVAGLVVLARQIGIIHRRIPAFGARETPAGPDIGEPAPLVRVSDLNGRAVELGGHKDKATLLVFVSSSCPACSEILPGVRSLARAERRRLETILISLSSVGATRDFVAANGLEGLPVVVARGDVDEAYRVATSPYGIFVARDGTVRSKGLVNSLEHLESLLNASEHEVATGGRDGNGGEA
ncbi:MAG: redoxin domain-containing protein [Actinomycetota bacterium]|nr:redoxin domain-containing protein [Actinomycetota bacterium]